MEAAERQRADKRVCETLTSAAVLSGPGSRGLVECSGDQRDDLRGRCQHRWNDADDADHVAHRPPGRSVRPQLMGWLYVAGRENTCDRRAHQLAEGLVGGLICPLGSGELIEECTATATV